MKNEKSAKKLKLNREVIRQLSTDDLKQVAGGIDQPRSVMVQDPCGGNPRPVSI
jgi:hypothetical protein